MKRIKASALCAALVVSLSACGSGDADENQVAASNAAMTNDIAMNDPNNPFAQSEMNMHDRMMAARGADVSESWARKMIEHHRGALEMSEVLLRQDPNSIYAPMARTTIADQGAEVQRLEKMLQGGAAVAPAGKSNSTASTRAAPATLEPKAAPKGASTPPPADSGASQNESNMTNGM